MVMSILTKKCFTPSRMRFYIACSACSSHWDKLQMPPKPPNCRHQVDVCADQLLSWWCITGPKGKSGGPPYHMIRKGGFYHPPLSRSCMAQTSPYEGLKLKKLKFLQIFDVFLFAPFLLFPKMVSSDFWPLFVRSE